MQQTILVNQMEIQHILLLPPGDRDVWFFNRHLRLDFGHFKKVLTQMMVRAYNRKDDPLFHQLRLLQNLADTWTPQ